MRSRLTLRPGFGPARLAWIACLAGMAVLACQHPATATLNVEPRLDGRQLTIVVTSDLTDGTGIEWEAWNTAEADTNDLASLDQAHFLRGSAKLEAGRVEASVDLTGWPAGETFAWAAFYPTADQPPETIARVGAAGERLQGPGVQDCSGSPCLIDWKTFALPTPSHQSLPLGR
jgi:hypothetical protein